MDFKKSIALIFASGLTGVAFAGGYLSPECKNNPVTVPCDHTAWRIGVTGFWMGLATDEITYTPVGLSGTRVYVHPPRKQKFAFGLDGSYQWGNGNDLTIDWFHYDKSIDLDGVTLSVPHYDIHENELNQIDVAIGQKITVNSNWLLRPHFGISYLQFHREAFGTNNSLATVNSGTYGTSVSDAGYFETDRYSSVGPSAGLDASYFLMNGFSIAARTNAMLLVGSVRTHDHASVFNAGVETVLSSEVLGKRHATILGFDSQISLNYQTHITAGSVEVKGGYASKKLINPLTLGLIYPIAEQRGAATAQGFDGWFATIGITY